MNRKGRRAAAKTGARPGSYPMARAKGQQLSHLDTLLANALRHDQAGQLKFASQACRQLLALDSNDVAALNVAGLISLSGGLNQVAFDLLSKAIELNEKIPDLHGGIAEALQRLRG